MTNTITITKEIENDLQQKISKYLELVWYARKGVKGSSYWDGVPDEIQHGALNSMARVEEKYPDEIDNLNGVNSNWEHGFNSGMLAALRYVLTAACPYETEDEFGEPYICGGLEEANEEFPELYT